MWGICFGGCFAESQAKVAELLKINNQIARKVANRADILTYDTRASLLKRIQKIPLPPKSVNVLRTDESPESREFTDVLSELMREAGCLGITSSVENVSTNRNAPGRVVVQAINPSFEKQGKLLALSIAAAGIPDVAFDPEMPLIGSGTIQITVKPK
jgi:hypothetical protein